MSVARDRPSGYLIPPGTPRSFHVLVKPTGAICNLDCTYCFFLSKEMLYPGSRFRMADELLERYLRQLIEAHAGARGGGDCLAGRRADLMGLDFFRRSVDLADGYRHHRQRITHTIQTNGTLLDDAWGEFLARTRFSGRVVDRRAARGYTMLTGSTRAARAVSTG